ncbi:oligosaccharide repeat unit polymerase [Pseudoalteromonas sp. YIC-656]|uniref:oligosaccharide repeat unit polymerase n=1 Tax=Pseudoalteromonas pernae TaxID=3118054 RepID=UPI003242D82E
MPAAFFVFIIIAFKFEHRKDYIYPASVFLMFLLLALVTTLFYGESSQVEDLFYLVHLFLAFNAVYFIIKWKLFSERFLLYFFSAIVALLALSAALQILGILGIIPLIWAPEGRPEGFDKLVTGPFANPNDLAVVELMLFCYVYWLADKLNRFPLKLFLIACTAFVILVTLSRASIVLFAVYFILLSLYKKQYLKLLALTLFAIASLAILITFASSFKVKGDDSGLVQRNLNRIASIDRMLSSKSNDSSGIRVNSYRYFFENIDEFAEPRGTDNYESFYNRADFDKNLIRYNPHSFFIESTLSFGYAGLLLLCLLMAFFTYYSMAVPNSYPVILIVFFIILSNIPSSIIKMPALWVPLFLAFYHQRYYVQKNPN